MTVGYRVPVNISPVGRCNPAMQGNIEASPCKSCELADYSKLHKVCTNCTLRMGYGYINSTREERLAARGFKGVDGEE